jgi:hypothetical protein
MKRSIIIVFAIFGVIVITVALTSWYYFSRVTASDVQGGYYISYDDERKVTITPDGYVTNAVGEVSSILAITNAGPLTFSYWVCIDTASGENGRGWVDYPDRNKVNITWGTTLLAPFSSGRIIVPIPSSQVRWRADLQLRDVHGTNTVGKLICLWEDYVKKEPKSGVVYSQE